MQLDESGTYLVYPMYPILKLNLHNWLHSRHDKCPAGRVVGCYNNVAHAESNIRPHMHQHLHKLTKNVTNLGRDDVITWYRLGEVVPLQSHIQTQESECDYLSRFFQLLNTSVCIQYSSTLRSIERHHAMVKDLYRYCNAMCLWDVLSMSSSKFLM